MNTTLLFLLKFLGTSGILYACYVLFLKNKTTYKQQRTALLFIPLISLAASLISLPVLERPIFDQFSELISSDTDEIAVGEKNASLTEEQTYTNFVIERGNVSSTRIYSLCVWFIVCNILSIIYTISILRIIRIKDLSVKEQTENYTLCRSGLIDAPYSWNKSIFVSKTLKDEKLDLIVAHEAAHISHKHYIDKILIELMYITMWFNPIVHIIRKELNIIHEYEADAQVMQTDCNMHTYMSYMVEEACGKIPNIATGFNQLLIKKRIQNMKNNQNLKQNALRTLLFAGATLCTFAMVSFTYADVNKQETVVKKQDTTEISETTQEQEKKQIERIHLKEHQYISTNLHNVGRFPSNTFIYVIRHKKYTEVLIGCKAHANYHWIVIGNENALVDPKTGDRYIIHSLKNDLPLNKPLIVHEQAGKAVFFKAIFPPLAKNIKFVDFKEDDVWDITQHLKYSSPGAGYLKNIPVLDELPHFANPNYKSEDIRLDKDFKVKE